MWALLSFKPRQCEGIIVASFADNNVDDVISVLLVTVGTEMGACV